MPDNGGGQPVAVNIGDCRCPGDPRPHPDGDIVYLAAKPSLRLGLAANAAIGQEIDPIGLQVTLGAVFVRYGAVAWNLVDERGVGLPLTPDAAEQRLTWDAGGQQVADKAADLYTEAIISPLLARLSSSRAPGPTDASISPQSVTPIPTSRKRSSRSQPEPTP